MARNYFLFAAFNLVDHPEPASGDGAGRGARGRCRSRHDPGGDEMNALRAMDVPYTIEVLDESEGLPLLIQARADSDPERLASWIAEHHEWLRQCLIEHGALLFRGFAVESAPTFERVVRAIDDELKNEYLGTSPRNGLTDYVFTASELPPFYPIPQHCEMSFTRNPPRRLFFCCLEAPAEGSGETPLADFRKVLRDLDPALVRRFEERGLRIVRNYSGPSGGSRFDPWRLKRWDEMFLSTDREAVDARCREEGFEPVWTEADGLRLVSTQPITREHPETGGRLWHNHSTTFHLSMAPGEYRRIHERRPTLRHWLLWQLSRGMVALQKLTRSTDELAMQCTFADGSDIPDADMEAIREAVWRHMVVFPWQRGDIVAIDNYAVSHGRLPYQGPRQVAVCWA
jgi:alpha-ketoglutarate-dependent taurine dioxygenase